MGVPMRIPNTNAKKELAKKMTGRILSVSRPVKLPSVLVRKFPARWSYEHCGIQRLSSQIILLNFRSTLVGYAVVE